MDAEFAQARADRAAAAAELHGIRVMIEGFAGLAQDVLAELKRQRADLDALWQREHLREATADVMTGLATAGGHTIPQPRRRGTDRPLRIVGKSG